MCVVCLWHLCARNKAEEEAEARMLGMCLALPSASLLVSSARVSVDERVFVGGCARASETRQTDRHTHIHIQRARLRTGRQTDRNRQKQKQRQRERTAFCCCFGGFCLSVLLVYVF